MTGPATSYLSWAMPTSRNITLEDKLDPDAFWPFVDTIGKSGGPRR